MGLSVLSACCWCIIVYATLVWSAGNVDDALGSSYVSVHVMGGEEKPAPEESQSKVRDGKMATGSVGAGTSMTQFRKMLTGHDRGLFVYADVRTVAMASVEFSISGSFLQPILPLFRLPFLFET